MWKRRITGIRSLGARSLGATLLGTFLLGAPRLGGTLAAAQVPAPQPDEPLVVSGPCVVFFSPSRAERDSIANSEGLEIDDLLDDFNLSAGKTAVYLSQFRIRTEFTEARTVIVRTAGGSARTFDRRSIPDPVGLILSDGVNAPKVVPGRGTDRDFIIAATEYFRLNARGGE
ncbi:MAG TPA: hypothetical protein VL221_04375 [Bacteroidota bacterium]|nr:hypothetical protein [Bacteroidota bacterium]